METHEIAKKRGKSTKIAKLAASWDEVTVSLRASFRLQIVSTVRQPWAPEIHGNQ